MMLIFKIYAGFNCLLDTVLDIFCQILKIAAELQEKNNST